MTHPADDAAEEYCRHLSVGQMSSPAASPWSSFCAGWDACAADPLHAAAPDLLEALEPFDWLPDNQDVDAHNEGWVTGEATFAQLRAVRAAIAVARPASGKEQG